MALRYRLKSLSELASREPPRWLIADLIQSKGLIAVYGESAAGKSFFALHLGAHIAQKKRWAGRRTKQAKVIYISLEGDSRNRAAAYLKEFGDVEGMLALENEPLSLLSETDVSALIRDIKAQLEGYTGLLLVIVDTWARAIAGGDENTGNDMGKAIASCSRIQSALNAVVLFIHHEGKDASRGMRGWSGLKAAVDGQIYVERTDTGDRFATFTKIKDGQDGLAVGFTLDVVDLGPRSAYDPEADESERDTSCVIRINMPVGVRPEKRRIGTTEKAIMAAMAGVNELPLPDLARMLSKSEGATRIAVDRLSKHEPITYSDGIVRRIKPS